MTDNSGLTATTSASGIATLRSPRTSTSRGSFIFTVTGVTAAGYSYDASKNLETSDSIAR